MEAAMEEGKEDGQEEGKDTDPDQYLQHVLMFPFYQQLNCPRRRCHISYQKQLNDKAS
jgi:hypothetical protein